MRKVIIPIAVMVILVMGARYAAEGGNSTDTSDCTGYYKEKGKQGTRKDGESRPESRARCTLKNYNR